MEKITQNSAKDVEQNKMFAALGYIGVLCLVPLLLKKESKFAQHHGKQGLVLFIIEIVVFFINIIPFLGIIIWFFASIFFVVVSIIGFKNAWQGKWWSAPVLSEYAEKVKL